MEAKLARLCCAEISFSASQNVENWFKRYGGHYCRCADFAIIKLLWRRATVRIKSDLNFKAEVMLVHQCHNMWYANNPPLATNAAIVSAKHQTVDFLVRINQVTRSHVADCVLLRWHMVVGR